VTQITLAWQASNGWREEILSNTRTVTIGRHPGCDIVLGDPHVSRRHASISFSRDSFHLHNHSRTNPVIFNERWSLTSDMKADLKPGDTFTVGQILMKVSVTDQADLEGDGEAGVLLELFCPSCGRQMVSRKEICPLCRVSIDQVETMFVTEDAY
jgi:predicted component of type VI protein secretion system